MRAAATRAALEDAFCALYADRPIEEIAVKEVVALAGCNRTTFYQHFDSVYCLLDQLETRAGEVVAAGMESTSARAGRVEDFPQAFVALLAGNEGLLRVLLAGSRSHSFKDRVRDLVRPVILEKLGLDDKSPQAASFAVDFYLAGVVETTSSLIVGGNTNAAPCLAETIDLILNEGVVAAASAGR